MKLVILQFVKKYWYHLVLVAATITAAGSIKGCINERDERIRADAERHALIVRDSIQVAAIRDSLVSTRKGYDTTAKALRSALLAYSKVRQPTGQRVSDRTEPRVERAGLQPIVSLTNISPAEVISYCKEFITAADSYKLYADSTIAAQGRMIHNLTFAPTPKRKMPVKLLGTVALVSLIGGIVLAKSF